MTSILEINNDNLKIFFQANGNSGTKLGCCVITALIDEEWKSISFVSKKECLFQKQQSIDPYFPCSYLYFIHILFNLILFIDQLRIHSEISEIKLCTNLNAWDLFLNNIFQSLAPLMHWILIRRIKILFIKWIKSIYYKFFDSWNVRMMNDHFDFFPERKSKQQESFYFWDITKIQFNPFHRLLMFDIFSYPKICLLDWILSSKRKFKNSFRCDKLVFTFYFKILNYWRSFNKNDWQTSNRYVFLFQAIQFSYSTLFKIYIFEHCKKNNLTYYKS